MSSPDFQHIRLRMVKDITLVEIITKDLKGPKPAKELGVELGYVIHQEVVQRLLVDFSLSRYLSSSGFAVLFNLVNQLKAAAREIRFCSMAQAIRTGASVVGLDKLVEIYDSEDAALEAFSYR
jgi:anti-sigma B factor antagonist